MKRMMMMPSAARRFEAMHAQQSVIPARLSRMVPGDEEYMQTSYPMHVSDLVGTARRLRVIKVDAPVFFMPEWWEAGMVIPSSMLAQAISAAGNDPMVGMVVLELNCPGGTVAGFDELATALAGARAMKPVVAVVHELAASLAYRLAAGCDAIIASPTADVGSIGTIILMYDDSAMYAEAGVVAKPVASDAIKPQGYPGVPLTDAFISQLQTDLVDPDYDNFVNEVAAARKIAPEAVRGIGAKMMSAPVALAAGLVDRVTNVAAYLRALASGV